MKFKKKNYKFDFDEKYLWINFIIKILNDKNIKTLSNKNIENCFKNFILEKELILLTKNYRDQNLITKDFLNGTRF